MSVWVNESSQCSLLRIYVLAKFSTLQYVTFIISERRYSRRRWRHLRSELVNNPESSLQEFLVFLKSTAVLPTRVNMQNLIQKCTPPQIYGVEFFT